MFKTRVHGHLKSFHFHEVYLPDNSRRFKKILFCIYLVYQYELKQLYMKGNHFRVNSLTVTCVI